MAEYNTLTDEEKLQILRSHVKNLQHNKYNIELYILAEQSIDVPNESNIISYQMQLDDINDKQAALEAQIATIEAGGTVV